MFDTGNTAFMLMASSLVLLMTPGLAFFYGGLVGRKNVLTIMMQSFVSMGVTTVVWWAYGYSLCFSGGEGGIIGNLDKCFLNGVTLNTLCPFGTGKIPEYIFIAYQLMVAIITPALITGAFSNRMRFGAYLSFLVAWLTFVYFPFAHMVWGGGLLQKMGVLDFGGGIVVHNLAGMAALAAVFFVGRRKIDNEVPHSLPLMSIGMGLLWFGWFGFNAGSALAANELAANAFITTNTATAAAGLTWALIEWQQHGAPTILGAATGAVAGLVAITPACGFVNPMNAIFIGALVSVFCYIAIAKVKALFKYDDALDVFGVHGVGGMWGTVATGLFAEKAVNEAGGNGLFFGDVHQFLVQLLLIVVAAVFAAVMTWILFKFVDALVGIRVEKNDEIIGLDLTQQSEAAYTVVE